MNQENKNRYWENVRLTKTRHRLVIFTSTTYEIVHVMRDVEQKVEDEHTETEVGHCRAVLANFNAKTRVSQEHDEVFRTL